MANCEEVSSPDRSDSSGSEEISKRFQQMTMLEYPQLVVNVDLIQKNIIKEVPDYSKKFSADCMQILSKEAKQSIEPFSKLNHLQILQEQRDIDLNEFTERTSIICENIFEQNNSDEDEKKQPPLFENREDMLNYIICKLSTIQTSDNLSYEEFLSDDD